MTKVMSRLSRAELKAQIMAQTKGRVRELASRPDGLTMSEARVMFGWSKNMVYELFNRFVDQQVLYKVQYHKKCYFFADRQRAKNWLASASASASAAIEVGVLETETVGEDDDTGSVIRPRQILRSVSTCKIEVPRNAASSVFEYAAKVAKAQRSK